MPSSVRRRSISVNLVAGTGTVAGDAAFSMVSADDFSTVLNPWERVIVPAPTNLPPSSPPSRADIFQQFLTPAADAIALSQQALIVAA